MASFPAEPTKATGEGRDAPGSSSTSSTAVPTPASLLDTAEAYENICGICFTEIHPVDNPRGRLNSCKHLFCSYCITEWAKNTNVCPSCKARFTRIYAIRADTQEEVETKVRRRNYKAWEQSYYDDEDEDEEEWEDSVRPSADSTEQVVCAICQQSNNAARMIFCDRRQCPYAAHLDCLGLAERPVTFLCPPCAELRERESDGGTAATATSAPVEAPLSSLAPALKERAPVASSAAPSRTARPATAHSTAQARRGAPSVGASRSTDARVGTAPTSSSLSSTAAARNVAAARPASRALYGGSRTSSSSSSSSSDSPVSSTPSRPAVVPRARIDFSKPHLSSLPPPTPTAASRSRRRRVSSVGTPAVEVEDGENDDLYFLAPTSHAVAATIEFERAKANRAVDLQTQRQRQRARVERLGSVHGAHSSPISGGSSSLSLLSRVGQKRPKLSAAEEVSAELEAAEKEFTDPQQRRAMEERMVRKWALDILPVLRRRRYVDGDTVTSEADMWTQATAQARKMVREKLDVKGASLRRHREQLVRAQANREAAALAKLARIIAQHREREQQNHPPTPSVDASTK